MVDCVLLYLIVGAFGVVGMLIALLGALLYLVLPRNRGKRIGRWINLGLFRLFAWVIRAAHLVYPDLKALDALREEKGIIIAPNHITSLDALFVISRLPNLVCIMKAPLWDNLVFGGGSRLAGYIRNDNSSAMFRKASDELQAGEQLSGFSGRNAGE